MAKWGDIKCPRCEELKDKLNYAVGEWRDYDKTIEQMEAERLANRAAIMRLEAKLAKAVEERDEALNQLDSSRHSVDVLEKRLAELTGGKDE